MLEAAGPITKLLRRGIRNVSSAWDVKSELISCCKHFIHLSALRGFGGGLADGKERRDVSIRLKIPLEKGSSGREKTS